MKRKTCLFIFIGAVLLGLPVSSIPASGYNIFGSNCRFDPANDYDGLGIGVLTTDPLYNSNQAFSTTSGGNAWNTVMVPQFTTVSYSSSTRDVRVEWGNLGASVGGRTTYWCGSGHYSQDPLFEWGANQTYYVSTADRRKVIAIHELGHTYGMNHNNSTSCNPSIAGLMYTDVVVKTNTCGWTVPTADDVNGAIDAHNG